MSKVKEIMIMINMIEKGFFMSKKVKEIKCDNCKTWKFCCGDFRRQCRSNDFKDYNPKN